jgi:hypothetical protein
MSEAAKTDLPEAKKQKISDETSKTEMTAATETKKVCVPESPDSEWPEAWFMMEEGTYDDQKALNKLSPNKPATVEVLKDLGIQFWKMDAETYSYPAKAIPWDPKDATDPKLKAIRDAREYTYIRMSSLLQSFRSSVDESGRISVH